MKPITSALGVWWGDQGLGIGHAYGVPHHWGLTLVLRGGCRPMLLDIALLKNGALEELNWLLEPSIS